MNYENININSNDYKLLSNKDKLRVVRLQIKELFEEGRREKHPYTITYNGEKVKVSKEKFGIFKDLLVREKKLIEKTASTINYYTLKDNSTFRSPLVDVKFDSEQYEKLNIKEKIAVVEAKYNHISNWATYNGKPFDSTNYCNELEEKLIELNEQLKTEENKVKNINIEIDSPEYNGLDTKSKIKVIEEKLYKLTTKENEKRTDDKKIHTVSCYYKEKKLVIPCSKIKDTSKLIKLLKELENNINIESEEKNEKEKNSLWSRFLAIPVIVRLMNKRKDKNKKSLKEKVMSTKLISKLTNKKKKEENKKTKRKSLKNRFLAIPFIAKIKNKRNDKKIKTKKTIKERYNNSAFGRTMKKKKNRVITAICAYALIIASFTSCFGFKSNKNINNNKTNAQKPSTSQVTEETEIEKTEDIIIEESTNSTIKEENNSEESSIDNNTNKDEINNKDNDVNKDDKDIIIDEELSDNYSLGDTVTIDEEAKIYTNSYDATYNTNAYNPYYNGGYDRIIEGVVYELDGYVYTIFNFDDEANSKIEELEKNGAKLTAILVNRTNYSNTNNYEGFYDIDSVKIRTKSR